MNIFFLLSLNFRFILLECGKVESEYVCLCATAASKFVEKNCSDKSVNQRRNLIINVYFDHCHKAGHLIVSYRLCNTRKETENLVQVVHIQ